MFQKIKVVWPIFIANGGERQSFQCGELEDRGGIKI